MKQFRVRPVRDFGWEPGPGDESRLDAEANGVLQNDAASGSEISNESRTGLKFPGPARSHETGDLVHLERPHGVNRALFFAVLAGLVVTIAAFATAALVSASSAAAQEERLRSANELIDSQLDQIQKIVDRMKADGFDIPDL